MAKQQKTQCAFCGNTAGAKPGVYFLPSMYEGLAICSECLDKAGAVLKETRQAEKGAQNASSPIRQLKVLTPAQIKAGLDQYVIGQEYSKKVLSVAVHNHYKRLQSRLEQGGSADQFAEVELDKSNVLLLGPTGCGKTLLASTLAKMLDVPFAIADATTLTEAGYVGEDVENILLRLYQAAGGDLERTQIGIIYIDEMDKISRKSENASITRDVSGEGVQQALLKILEGTIANVPPQGGRKHPQQEYLHIDTRNILFICGGAFVGLDKIIQRRCGRQVLGFTRELSAAQEEGWIDPEVLAKNPLPYCEPEDLVHFGLIPELVGRLPVLTTLEPLDKAALLRVLSEPKNALIKQYQRLLAMENVQLEFTQKALEELAERAVRRGTGARGLRSILEKLMLEVMFDAPSHKGASKCVIGVDVVRGDAKPKLS